MNKVTLPGSTGDEAEIRRGGGLGDGDAAALAGLLAWWRGRLARGDAADPLQSGFGGVDDSGTARTLGTTAATVVLPRPLVVPAGGLGLWIHALGVPLTVDTAGELFSLVGLCHFYYHPTQGWYSRYATLGRAPAWITSTEVRAVLTGPPPGDTPILQLVGVANLTIEWKVEVYRLERGWG